MAITSSSLKRRVSQFARPGILAAGLCLLQSNALYADDNWGFQPSISQNLSWDSNPLLLSTGHSTLFGSVTAPQLKITDNSPTTQLNALATVDENIFNQSDFNSTDAHGNISLDKKLQQWEAGFTEQADYDTTRTSEVSTLDINSQGSVRHFGNSFSPTISFSPNAVDKISLSGAVTTSHYDGNQFTDYHILSITPSFSYNYNPLNTATISVLTQRYQTDVSPDLTVDSIAPTLGWSANLTPTWTAKASAGYEEYRQEGNNVPSQQWKWKPVYSADLSYNGSQDVFSLDASKALQPYGNGTEYFLSTFSLSDNHAINPLFSVNGTASYQFAGNSDQAATNLKSLISADAGVTYHATTKVDVTTSYQYREQTLTNVQGNQNDNIFMVGLVYRPVLPIIK